METLEREGKKREISTTALNLLLGCGMLEEDGVWDPHQHANGATRGSLGQTHRGGECGGKRSGSAR